MVRRAWQPTPVYLPGGSHGQRNLVGCSPWGHKESDTTEGTNTHAHTRIWWWRILSISVPREPPWLAFPRGIYLGGLDLGTHGLLRSMSHLSPRVKDRLTPEQILCRERKAVNNTLEQGTRHCVRCDGRSSVLRQTPNSGTALLSEAHGMPGSDPEK